MVDNIYMGNYSIFEIFCNGNPDFWKALTELENNVIEQNKINYIVMQHNLESPRQLTKEVLKTPQKGVKRKHSPSSMIKICLNCNNEQKVISGKQIKCLKCNKRIPVRPGGKKKCSNCGNLEYNRINTCSSCKKKFKCFKKLKF